VSAIGGEEWVAAGEALGNFDALAALAALRATPADTQAAVKRLDGAEGDIALDMAAEVAMAAASMDEASPVLDDIGQDLAAIAGIIAANAAENSDGRRALYPTLSMANHSCAPNAAWRTANAATGEKELVCIAPRVADGEEVCITYLQERELFLLDGEARQCRLQAVRGFTCLCTRCSGDAAENKDHSNALSTLVEGLLAGAPAAPDRNSAVQQCKDIGAQLRRLDSLWPAASALKASLWSSYVDLLIRYGAPQQLLLGAARRFLDESKPCLSDAAWSAEERALTMKLLPRCSVPEPRQLPATMDERLARVGEGIEVVN